MDGLNHAWSLEVLKPILIPEMPPPLVTRSHTVAVSPKRHIGSTPLHVLVCGCRWAALRAGSWQTALQPL